MSLYRLAPLSRHISQKMLLQGVILDTSVHIKPMWEVPTVDEQHLPKLDEKVEPQTLEDEVRSWHIVWLLRRRTLTSSRRWPPAPPSFDFAVSFCDGTASASPPLMLEAFADVLLTIWLICLGGSASLWLLISSCALGSHFESWSPATLTKLCHHLIASLGNFIVLASVLAPLWGCLPLNPCLH